MLHSSDVTKYQLLAREPFSKLCAHLFQLITAGIYQLFPLLSALGIVFFMRSVKQ